MNPWRPVCTIGLQIRKIVIVESICGKAIFSRRRTLPLLMFNHDISIVGIWHPGGRPVGCRAPRCIDPSHMPNTAQFCGHTRYASARLIAVIIERRPRDISVHEIQSR